jgi:hypothetical protein
VVGWIFANGSKRFPLVITEDGLSLTAVSYKLEKSCQNTEKIYGSPFSDDQTNSEYIAKSIY